VVSTHYDLLTDGEQAHFDEYATLRSISDWPGFQPDQDERRADSRSWLQEKRKEIWRLAQPASAGGDGNGWDHANRRERYETLKDENLNSSTVQRPETTLPAGGGTDPERSLIEEREIWWQISSTTDEQKARKQACTDWLIARRKQLWHLIEDDPAGNEANHRQTRYENLCIATKHGSPYEQWDAEHDEYGKVLGGAASTRDAICAWLDKYVGVTENPKGSNRGEPQPSTWQRRVYGGDGVPWCACFSVCSAWDNEITGSGTAGVWNNTQLAKNGQGIYKGWTSDPSKVRPGDHMFCGDDHTGVARGTLQSDGTILGVEGNTSGATSSGSQWNGDLVAKKPRPASYWTAGFGLIRAD
jgi:hypothetical protein